MGMSEWPDDRDAPIENTTRTQPSSPRTDGSTHVDVLGIDVLGIAKAVAGGALAGVVFLGAIYFR